MNIKQIHREAMVFAQEAHLLQQNGDFEKSIELFEKAFELEQQAALFYLNQDKEPTRSILFKSAAALANNCKRYRDAEKMIGFALSGNPPIEIADEIRNLYENINFYRHLELRDVELDNSEIYLSLTGNSVGYGIINSGEFLSRAQIFEQLTYRTVERKLGKEFRKSGSVSKEIKDRFEPYFQRPIAASFAIQIRIGKPTKQTNLFPDEDIYTQVVDEIFNSITLFNNENEDQLKEQIPNDAYFQNFVSLAQKLSPDGDKIKQVGLTVVRKGQEQTLALQKTQKDIKSKIVRINQDSENDKPFDIKGNLKKADGFSNKITLINDEDKKFQINVPDGLDDIVKMYWDDNVIVTIKKSGKHFQLIDINKDE